MKKFTFFLFSILFPTFLFTQTKESTELFKTRADAPVSIFPHLEFGIPLGDFQNKINKDILYGKGISIFYRSEFQPIDFGLRIGDLVYDNITRNIDSNQLQKSKNKIWMWYGAFRYEPNIAFPISPYFEGTFGFTRFFSKTFSRDRGVNAFEEEWFNERFDEEKLNSDWALGYGGALGFYYTFEKDFFTTIDFQVGYQTRGIGTFLIRNELPIQETPSDNFYERRSNLDLISIKIGITVLIFNY